MVTRQIALIAVIGLCVLYGAPVNYAQQVEVLRTRVVDREYRIKSAFLVHFANFVEWPAQVFSVRQEIVIGILGNHDFGDSLESIEGKSVQQGHRIRVKYFRNVTEIDTCHILFVSAAEQENLPEILTALTGKSILTVGDQPGFVSAGGIVNFVTSGNKVRFEINTAAVKRSDLRVSSQLLRVARLVGS